MIRLIAIMSELAFHWLDYPRCQRCDKALVERVRCPACGAGQIRPRPA